MSVSSVKGQEPLWLMSLHYNSPFLSQTRNADYLKLGSVLYPKDCHVQRWKMSCCSSNLPWQCQICAGGHLLIRMGGGTEKSSGKELEAQIHPCRLNRNICKVCRPDCVWFHYCRGQKSTYITISPERRVLI